MNKTRELLPDGYLIARSADFRSEFSRRATRGPKETRSVCPESFTMSEKLLSSQPLSYKSKLSNKLAALL